MVNFKSNFRAYRIDRMILKLQKIYDHHVKKQLTCLIELLEQFSKKFQPLQSRNGSKLLVPGIVEEMSIISALVI